MARLESKLALWCAQCRHAFALSLFLALVLSGGGDDWQSGRKSSGEMLVSPPATIVHGCGN